MPTIDPEVLKAILGFVGALGSLRYSSGPLVGRVLQIPLFALVAFYGCDWAAAYSGMPPSLSALMLGLFSPVTVGKLYATWERVDLTKILKRKFPSFFGDTESPPPGDVKP